MLFHPKCLKILATNKGLERNRHARATKFEMELRQSEYKEKQNQLIWQTSLGADPLAESKRNKILNHRRSTWDRYEMKRGDKMSNRMGEDGSSITAGTIIRNSFRRTFRLFDNYPVEMYGGPNFDPYNNDFWRLKMERIEIFQQAARAVLIRNRSDKKIVGLRKLKNAFNEGRKSIEPETAMEGNI